MGNTWVTDMSHFDYPEAEAHNVPRAAVRIATYFASIIEGTVRRMTPTGSTGIRCRRRPGRAPCAGVIESEIRPQGNELRWWCPVCDDNGLTYNWAGTRWDPGRKVERYRSGELFGRQPPARQETHAQSDSDTILGRIVLDESTDGELPKIVTANGKEYGWAELGKEMTTYEGWPIKIVLG